MESLSNKGKRCFIHENNKFRSYPKDQQGNEYWRCTINRCTARLKTSTVGEVVELISNHAHADTVQNKAVQILRTACKRKTTDTACESPSKVIVMDLGWTCKTVILFRDCFKHRICLSSIFKSMRFRRLCQCVFVDFYHAFFVHFVSCVFIIFRNAFSWSFNALS